MRTSISLKTLCGCVLLFAISPGRSSAQAAAAPQAAPAVQSAQPASICSGRAGCYETTDFAAVMTDFRLSMNGGWKLIDTTLHFQNKTNQPLILGYTEGSAMAIDDQGNRYGLAGQPNAVRGIGRIQGNSIDAKFSLPPGGGGDTMFELAWAPGNATQGVNFELDLSIREVKALEGQQFSLAGETPLQFRGLANGMFAGSTAGTTAGSAGVGGAGLLGTSGTATNGGALPVCGSGSSGLSSVAANANAIGGQNVPASANSTISNASAQISNLKSMFHKKAAVAPATPAVASAATPCVPATSATGSTATPSAIPAVAVPTSAATQSGATPAVATTSSVTSTAVAPASAATTTSAAQPAARVSQTTPARAAAAPRTTTVTTVTTTKTVVTTPKPAAKKPAPVTTSTTPPK
jgi:hypothetical protein